MPTLRSVLITGCSEGGIGAALVQSFADRDFRVFATARDVGKMAVFKSRPNVTLLQLDVTNDKHISNAVQSVSDETGGKLDFLVNNAAHNRFMPMLDESIEDAKGIFDSNVWGPLSLIKAFNPLLIATKGSIVNITSISGYLNVPWMGTYAASKRSLEIMAETLRLELQPFGVNVASIVTGAVDTNGLTYFDDLRLPDDSLYKSVESTFRGCAKGATIPKNISMTATDFAEKVVSPLLKSNQSGIVWGPGNLIRMNKFLTTWVPTWIADSMFIKGSGIDQMLARSK